ncbi:MAG: class I SAM-dependent methyltransferase [bacterium]
MVTNTEQSVADHYTRGSLLETILNGIKKAGKSVDSIQHEDLAPLDEFHLGGREATRHFLGQMGLTREMSVLDIGCGLGGAARFCAIEYGSILSGIDLTQEFIETGKTLTSWLKMDDLISLKQGSALELPLEDSSFDAAYMMHVGMNIPDKAKLCREASRVLKKGGSFGIYDVMKTSETPLNYPVPWAENSDSCSIGKTEEYLQALADAGFEIQTTSSRKEFALEFFRKWKQKMSVSKSPPPLGLHLVMGENFFEKLSNFLENIQTRRVAPFEIFAKLPE